MISDSPDPAALGHALQALVNRVSHRGGASLEIMASAQVTLQQVLLLARILETRAAAPSVLAAQLGMSPSSISQMLDRLAQLELIVRSEHPTDRRKRQITLSSQGRRLMARLQKARADEYAAGVAGLSEPVRRRLWLALHAALDEMS
ncbi:MAG: MarR family transcriptional regulator [Myxococcales bacterium FL481]|nr:MAG: MarR family transcriptional regulator [Myxococcales bacterium FL481]